MKLNDAEQKVLSILVEESTDYGYLCFAAIGERLRLDRKAIRRACRSLARKGLAEFGRGLWSDEGMPAGSGYAATELARDSKAAERAQENAG